MASANRGPAPAISSNEAVALALNELTPDRDGSFLRHPRHTAGFTACAGNLAHPFQISTMI
jgi:hypothetical protein